MCSLVMVGCWCGPSFAGTSDGAGQDSVGAHNQAVDQGGAWGVVGAMPGRAAAWHAQEGRKFAAAEQLVAGESRVSAMTGQVLPNMCLAGDPGCAGAPLPSQAYVTKNQHAQN